MADTVRYLMEQMVPELEDMQKKRYFSRQEVKEIVRKRQDFEYKLKRKAALKEDFLRCAAARASGGGGTRCTRCTSGGWGARCWLRPIQPAPASKGLADMSGCRWLAPFALYETPRPHSPHSALPAHPHPSRPSAPLHCTHCNPENLRTPLLHPPSATPSLRPSSTSCARRAAAAWASPTPSRRSRITQS